MIENRAMVYITRHARQRYVERILNSHVPNKRRIDKEIKAFAQVNPEQCSIIKRGRNSYIIATIFPLGKRRLAEV